MSSNYINGIYNNAASTNTNATENWVTSNFVPLHGTSMLTGGIIPANNTVNLGSVSSPFQSVFVNDLTVNGTIGPANGNITNIAIGYEALSSNNGGEQNVAVGYGALVSNGVNGNNIAIGSSAMASVTTANNIAIGAGAGQTTPNGGTVNIGTNAGQTSCGTFSINIGKFAGQTNCPSECININASGQTVNPAVANTITLNASGSAMAPANGGFFVNPITYETGTGYVPNSNADTWGMMIYNPSTGEIRYVKS